MGTKTLVIAVCWAVAVLLFFLTGFDIVTSKDWNLVAIGLGLFNLGFLIQLVWAE